MSRIIVLLAALAAMALSTQDARAEFVNVQLSCQNGAQLTKSVSCLPGQQVTINYSCPGEKEQVREFQCPGIIGNWGLSVGGSYLDATRDGGPSMGGVEVQFLGHFRMVRDWFWLSAKVAPGAVSNGESKIFALSDSASLDFRPVRSLSLRLAASHRGAFGAKGGSINAFMGEVGLDLNLDCGLTLGAFGSFGGAWFPVHTETSELNPHSQMVETTTTDETGTGRVWATGISAGWTFF